MNRTIDADALTKRFVEFCNKNCPYTAKARNVMCGSCFMGLALEAVEDAPTIESQEIIRCKDCKYADDDGVCQNSVGLVIQDDDDFCSKAERRTDEQT